jgi:hypothetical protein
MVQMFLVSTQFRIFVFAGHFDTDSLGIISTVSRDRQSLDA